MCAASRSNAAPAGVYRGTTSAEGNSRAPGCRAQGPLKGWNERGEYAVAFFSEQKKKGKKSTFKYRNYTTLHM